MLTLGQVKDWLKSQDTDLNGCIAVGSIDGNKEKYVGVYSMKPSGSTQRICIGGADQTRYQSRGVSILIHWTNNPAAAEAKAIETYNRFYGLSDVTMGTTHVISVDPGPEPIPVGKDSKGICEYVIQLKILYERT
jgi:hypothetical protein